MRDVYVRAVVVLLIVVVEVAAISWFGQSSFAQPFINQCKTSGEICNIIINSGGAWTLITLIISAPVAYVIWHFRDTNARQQIENQRKDVNLNEFQKIAEWVSGAHLVEEKITEKNKATKKGSEQESSEQETACEYSRQPEKQNITTFSKQDGAVGLQIAAVYMLLPFYRGDHGEDFRRPAFNLLTAAWLSLFSKVDDIETGQELAKQPLAVAITEVLFADGGLVYSTEKKYKYLLVNFSLPFVNLNLPIWKDDKNVLTFFQGRECLWTNLRGARLDKLNLKGANLKATDLRCAYLEKANLEDANLSFADLRSANLENANLSGADLDGAYLKAANLRDANLFGAKLTESDFHELPVSINQNQKADLIVLASAKFPISMKKHRLIATRKTFAHTTRKKIEYEIDGFQFDEQKTKELNQANWEIEIKELPPDTP